MPQLTSAQIVINNRTLRIGSQTYSLGNLARVQIAKLEKPPQANWVNIALAGLAGFWLFIVMAVTAPSTGIPVIGVWLLPIGLGVFVYQRRKRSDIPRYALMLETTGRPKTVLISTDRDALEYASAPIIDAMENPPETERTYTVNNVISGDQYNLIGDHNIGKLGSRD